MKLLAIGLVAGLCLAACGDDSGGTKVDAAAGDDGAITSDGGPPGPDAAPPDAHVSCMPAAGQPAPPADGPKATTQTRIYLTTSGQSATFTPAPVPLPVLATAMEPAEALTAPMHVSVPNATCAKLVHFVSPSIAIPTNSTIREIEATWNGTALTALDVGKSEIAETPYSYGEQLSFFKPMFSLEGIAPGPGMLAVRGFDASHTMVAIQTIANLEVVAAPNPVASCDLTGAHPRIWLTPLRLAKAKSRDKLTDPAARRFFSKTDGVDYFLEALKTIPDPLSTAFSNAVYDPESYIPALALCYQLAKGVDTARATTCANAARTLAVKIATDYDTNVRSFGRDTGYDIRFGLMQLMLAYDWIYDVLSASDRALLVKVGTNWIDWYAANGYARNHPHENYYAGWLQGLTLTTLATAGDNPATDRLLTLLNQRLYWEMPIMNQRLCGGDWPEGWNYGPYSLQEFTTTSAALKDLGFDWSPVFGFTQAEPLWMTYQMSSDFTNLISFGGYSGNLPHKTSPALLAVLSSLTPQGGLAARLYTTGLATANNDLSDGTRGFTAFEMIFADVTQQANLGALSLSYLAPGTGRFVSKSSLTDTFAYQVTAENMSYFYDHYGYANGDVRLYHGSSCLLCPAAYRGPSFRGEDTTKAFSTFLVNGMEQKARTVNNQILFSKEAATYSAIGMRFESSYAPMPYEESIIADGNPLDYLIREAVHIRPGTLVVRDLSRRRHTTDTLSALWHLGSSAGLQDLGGGSYKLGTLTVRVFGGPTPVFSAENDDGATRIGTLMKVDPPASTAPFEMVTVFSEDLTATSYTGGVLKLSNNQCVTFAGGTASVAACP